ncbi:MAG: alpha/beta hydrolase [Bacteroidota bacterium]
MRLFLACIAALLTVQLSPVRAQERPYEPPTLADSTDWAAYLPPHGSPASPLGFWRGVITRDGASQIIELDIAPNDTIPRDPETGAQALVVRCTVPDWFAWPGYACGQDAVYAEGTLTTRLLYGLRVPMRLDSTYGELVGVAEGVPTPVTAHFRRAVRPAQPAIRTVELSVPSGDATMAGTLVLPDRPGAHPAVVFVHGRGRASRQREPYREQANVLARHGIAAFVYDKRGVAASTGDFDAANLHDHADDVAAIMQALAARADIDAAQVGLHGTSAGGWVVTIAQAASPIPPAFVVTKIGPFESVYDQQWHVAEAYMAERDYTPAQIAAAIDYVKLESGTDASDAAVQAMVDGAAQAEAEGWDDILVDPPMTRATLEASWARVNRYDPADDLARMTMPVLAFFGAEDYVVHPAYNIPAFEAAMTANGNPDATAVVLRGMDHSLENPNGLRTFDGDRSTRYHYLWNRIAAGYGETLLAWLQEHVTLAE